jgi:hypothetical protein
MADISAMSYDILDNCGVCDVQDSLLDRCLRHAVLLSFPEDQIGKLKLNDPVIMVAYGSVKKFFADLKVKFYTLLKYI